MITQLAKYRIAGTIARGGMGTVYRAFDTSLNRMVALKVLSPELSAEPGFTERFRREAITAAGLRHNNIVTIYELGSDQEQYFIAMEYVAGGDLRNLIREEGPLAPSRVGQILTQLAAALDYAHSQKVIHRDIKPSNVLIESEDEVKLADFGIAKALSSATHLTGTQVRIGTPAYMSPEQVDGQPLTRSSDIYSLGIVVYEMLTGIVPFTGETTSAVLYAHVHKRPPSLRSQVSTITRPVERVVLQALAKRSQDRFANAGAFAAAFQEAVAAGDRLSASLVPAARVTSAVVGVALLLGAGWAVGNALLPKPKPSPTPVLATATRPPATRTPTPITVTATPPRGPQSANPPAGASSAVPAAEEVRPTAGAPTDGGDAPSTLPPMVTLVPTATAMPTYTPSPTVRVTPTTAGSGTLEPTGPATKPSGVAAPIPLKPPLNETVKGRITFEWQPVALPAGTGYEVVWWIQGEDPNHAPGFAPPTTQTSLEVDLGGAGLPADRPCLWAVLVVQLSPYHRLVNGADAVARPIVFKAVSCREKCDTCTTTDPVTGETKTSPCSCRTMCD